MQAEVMDVCNVNGLQLWMLVVLCLCSSGVKSNSVEDLLVKTLLKTSDYEKLSRPVVNVNETVMVTLGLNIAKVIKLSELDETLAVHLWHQIVWTDPRLVWNPNDFDGKTSIFLPSDQLWVPSIIQVNSAKDGNARVGRESEDAMKMSMINVNHDGSCSWYPNYMSVSYCPIDVRWFPFDVQECSLDYELWDSYSNEVNMTAAINKTARSSSQLNGEWEIVEKPVRTSHLQYECCSEIYTKISFVVQLRRKTLYYIFNYVVPGILFSAIILSTFILQTDSSDRTALSSALLLGITVYQLIINDKLPPTSTGVPLMGVYFMFVMVMCGTSVIMSIIVMGLHNRTTTMPPWLKRFLRRNQATESVGIEMKTTGEEREEKGQGDWIELAQRLDRLLFIIFATCLVIGSITLLVQANKRE